MPRWSQSREREWKSFCRVLGRMGASLKARRDPDGGYRTAPAKRLHPLVELLIGDAGVAAAIGPVTACEEEQQGVLSWVNVRDAGSGTTIRLNHKGTREHSQRALDAAIDALRAIGRRVSFRDMIRHENQNGYIALIRVADPAPGLAMVR